MKPILAGVHHVALCVADVSEAVNFYVDVIGCSQRTDRPDFGFPGAWLDAGPQQIHLMAFGDPQRTMSHFALQVDDIDAWCDHLDNHSVEYQRSARTPGAGQQVFLHDHAGNQVELNQPD